VSDPGWDRSAENNVQKIKYMIQKLMTENKGGGKGGGKGQGNGGGWPSGTGKPSGGGRSNG
jgi:hypothetical protein